MTDWLADPTVAHLRDVADWPDLGERYEVARRLGRGGMGVVYAAHDRVLDREVAVKVLESAAGDRDAARRLQDEARILGRLEHPGIVPVHDAGTLADGRVYYVMKLVRGERLDAALGARTSLADRLDIFLRIGDTVSFAHAQGIVHRDLKPANIMLGSFGELLVLDWGVARVLASAAADEAAAGTPGFMAPEQASGRADVRSDVYALGVILRGLLDGSSPAAIRSVASRACAERIDERYPSVAALTADVVRFRDGQRVEAHRETPFEQIARVYRRHRLPILLVAAYMLMRTALLLWRGI